MDRKTDIIVQSIKKQSRIKKVLSILCVALMVLSFTTFGFYAFQNNQEYARFVADYKKIAKREIEKVMINPRIRIEHSNNEFYDIKAARAVNKDKEMVVLHQVSAKGYLGNIEAEELTITDNGNNLRFSGNPVFVIYK